MIENERQYNITRAQARRLEAALAEIRAAAKPEGVEPIIRQAEIAALASQLADLRAELEEYEDLRGGAVHQLEVESLERLPEALIKARIALGLNQRQLGRRLGLKEQQIQRYEAGRYASASFSRILEVADALELRLERPAHLAFGGPAYATASERTLRVADDGAPGDQRR